MEVNSQLRAPTGLPLGAQRLVRIEMAARWAAEALEMRKIFRLAVVRPVA